MKAFWVEEAIRQVGTSEIKGSEHSQKIIDMHARTNLKAKNDETAWCAAAANYVLEECGIKGTNLANARSFLKWGKKLKDAKFGCIVVFWRNNPDSWQGHVGFVVGETAKSLYVLGGNQDDSMNIKAYSKDKVLGYRWPILNTN